MTAVLREGWYLMSTRDLELELRRWRDPGADVPPSNALPLGNEEALAYRNAGNLPDELGRTLRLVLIVDNTGELRALDRKRLAYEPDVHEPPRWRREGSRPVNVVPLRRPGVPAAAPPEGWWSDSVMGEYERSWRATGEVEGLRVPGEWRGFVFKTVAALRAAGRPVTVDTVVGSVARWLRPPDLERLERALRAANPG